MSFYFIEIDQKLNWSLNSNFESSLGGLTFGIDADGNYGYKKVGADTVIPFRKIKVSSVKRIEAFVQVNGITKICALPENYDMAVLIKIGSSSVEFTSATREDPIFRYPDGSSAQYAHVDLKIENGYVIAYGTDSINTSWTIYAIIFE